MSLFGMAWPVGRADFSKSTLHSEGLERAQRKLPSDTSLPHGPNFPHRPPKMDILFQSSGTERTDHTRCFVVSPAAAAAMVPSGEVSRGRVVDSSIACLCVCV